MANIEIDNLHPTGSALFQDSENFLNELSDREMWGVQGGLTLDTLGSEPLISGNSGLNITGADSLGGTLGETLGSLLGGTLGLLGP
ncbi:hypothetical protein [Nostoc sp. MG11]|uniref:hypothetical protein n=1 Tax=Nostoc sp. MG11 TaxID=2721166 RepID=UPI001866A478|nr:hypothetical protein [Nostoc sp. MG11]